MDRSSLGRSKSPSTDIDSQFVILMLEIEKRYKATFNRHDCIRIEQWSKRLCQPTVILPYKKTRNQYVILLLEQTLNGKLDKPFTSLPPEGTLPSLGGSTKSFREVMAKLAKGNSSLSELEKNEIVRRQSPAAEIKKSPYKPIVEEKCLSPPKENFHNESLRAFIELKNKSEEMKAKEDQWKTGAEILRLKSETDILKATIQNLKEQLLNKNEIISKQAKVIEEFKRTLEKSREENSRLGIYALTYHENNARMAKMGMNTESTSKELDMEKLKEETDAIFQRSRVLLTNNSSAKKSRPHSSAGHTVSDIRRKLDSLDEYINNLC